MKKKITIAGCLLGIINFFYFYLLLSLILYFFYHKNILSAQINISTLIYLISSYLLFTFYSIFESRRIIKNFAQFIKTPYTNKVLELIEFIMFSIIILLLFYFVLKIKLTEIYLVKSTVYILFFLIIGSLSFKKIYCFFSNIIILNLFYDYYSYDYIDDNKIYRIDEFDDFLDKSQELINQAKRFGLNLGIIVLYFNNLDKFKDFQYQKFLRKQINFILIENSRNYEHWGRSKEKDIYIKIVEVKDKDDLIETSERFFSILKQNQFYILNKPITLDFKMLGVYLKKDYFESNDINLMDEFLLIVKQDFEVIRRMEEDLRIIEIE